MKRRRARGARGLAGIKTAPLHMADFMIGQDIGIPPGTKFGTRGARCVAGADVRRFAKASGGGRVPYAVARREFLKARAAQVGAPATGATLTRGEGAWDGGQEPSFVGQVIFDGRAERSVRQFRANMRAMCEVLACRLSQREVLLRLWDARGNATFSRCTPTGAPKP